MGTFVLGWLCGAPVGAALLALTGALRRKRTTAVGEEGVPLTDADREVISTEFATHAHAMREQIEHFADTLAGDDVLLRERLRRFEKDGES